MLQKPWPWHTLPLNRDWSSDIYTLSERDSITCIYTSSLSKYVHISMQILQPIASTETLRPWPWDMMPRKRDWSTYMCTLPETDSITYIYILSLSRYVNVFEFRYTAANPTLQWSHLSDMFHSSTQSSKLQLVGLVCYVSAFQWKETHELWLGASALSFGNASAGGIGFMYISARVKVQEGEDA